MAGVRWRAGGWPAVPGLRDVAVGLRCPGGTSDLVGRCCGGGRRSRRSARGTDGRPGKAVAVLGSGPRALQQLLLLQRFTDDLTLLGTGAHDLDIDQLRYLRHVGIDICADPVSRVLSKDDQLTGVEFASGEVLDREVL